MTAATATTATTVNFSHLPDVSFTEMDASKVEETAIRTFEYFRGQAIFPGDPRRIMLTTLSALLVQILAEIDDTGKRNLLRYAGEDDLPHLGALLDTSRLGVEHAETEMVFTIAEPRDYAVAIPLGTRVTPRDKQIYFATVEAGEIIAGETTVTLTAKALAAGAEANGLIPGQINLIVDHFEHAITTVNTRTSSGGADVEDLETYRARIHLAPERFACAGPRLAYKYFALSARPGLADVEPYSPHDEPGNVYVYILLASGQIPDADGPEIADVFAALSAEKVRPLTDHVFVLPPEALDYDYRVTYYLYGAQAGYESSLDTAVRAAVASYEAYQTGKIGRDINPDELRSVCRGAGVKRIVPERVYRDSDGTIIRTEPMDFLRLLDNQVARIPATADRVVFGGFEDE